MLLHIIVIYYYLVLLLISIDYPKTMSAVRDHMNLITNSCHHQLIFPLRVTIYSDIFFGAQRDQIFSSIVFLVLVAAVVCRTDGLSAIFEYPRVSNKIFAVS